MALELTKGWPVLHASAAVVTRSGTVSNEGPSGHRYRLASLAKVVAAYAVLIGCEEGIVALDDPVGQPDCTLRHLLCHAGGYAFDGPNPITRPASRRIYSNTGIEMACDHLAAAAAMPFEQYLDEAVLGPLGMLTTELLGSPAHQLWSTVADMTAFAAELMTPTLLTTETAALISTPQFPGLPGMVPGVGSFTDCSWGIGAEIKAAKAPHWTGTTNSPATFGHFGGSGTFMWVDPAVEAACIALTDRAFDEWQAEALRLWPALSDAVLRELRS